LEKHFASILLGEEYAEQLNVCFLLGLLFDHKDGSEMFSPDYTTLYLLQVMKYRIDPLPRSNEQATEPHGPTVSYSMGAGGCFSGDNNFRGLRLSTPI
jgi:hypothetical protein